MVEREWNNIPELSIKVSNWKRCVDDRIAHVKTDAIYYVLSV